MPTKPAAPATTSTPIPAIDLGPLAPLSGVWEGEKGNDVAPDDDFGVEKTAFRERLTFEPLGPVRNHAQTLYGLRYATKAWPRGSKDPFHEELGYWLWDPAARQVLRCFLIPRGVTVLAGGTVEPGARQFELRAEAGSPTYGICSNQFLDREFKTVRYTLKVTILDERTFSYEEDTELQIPGQPIFHHRDGNTLTKVGSF